MKLTKFKDFLKKRITELEKEIDKIETKIKRMPKPENIKLSTYGSIKKLKTMYPESKKNIIKKIFGPTKKDIQKEIHFQELTKLNEKLKVTQEKKLELENTIISIENDTITKQLEKNIETLKAIVAFANEENLKSQDIIKLIVFVLKNSNTDINHIENKITQNIATFFKEDLTINKESKIETLQLLFDKLFFMIFDKKEFTELSLVITSIKNELELIKKTSSKSKEELITQKESIYELQKYLKGHEIIKIHPNILEFEQLLINSGIEESEISKLKEIMEEKIKKENEIKSQAEIEKLMNSLLSETEIKYINMTKTILNDQEENEVTIILQRIYDDIISLFKYLSLIGLTSEYDETTEIITQKISELKVIINNTKYSSERENSFYYITDKNNIPIVLHNIQMTDLVEHHDINRLFYQLASKNSEGNFMFQKGKIDFYEISNLSSSIIYVKNKNDIIVICLERKINYEAIEKRVNDTLINEIKNIINHKKTKEYKQLHKMYENLIIQALDLNNTKESIYIHQKKKD